MKKLLISALLLGAMHIVYAQENEVLTPKYEVVFRAFPILETYQGFALSLGTGVRKNFSKNFFAEVQFDVFNSNNKLLLPDPQNQETAPVFFHQATVNLGISSKIGKKSRFNFSIGPGIAWMNNFSPLAWGGVRFNEPTGPRSVYFIGVGERFPEGVGNYLWPSVKINLEYRKYVSDRFWWGVAITHSRPDIHFWHYIGPQIGVKF